MRTPVGGSNMSPSTTPAINQKLRQAWKAEDSHRKVALGISPIDRVGAGVEVGCDVVELASAAVKPRYREERKDDQEGDYKPHPSLPTILPPTLGPTHHQPSQQHH